MSPHTTAGGGHQLELLHELNQVGVGDVVVRSGQGEVVSDQFCTIGDVVGHGCNSFSFSVHGRERARRGRTGAREGDAVLREYRSEAAARTALRLCGSVRPCTHLTRNVITATINTSGTPGSPIGYSEVLTLSNLGKGQAISCYYVMRRTMDNHWCWLRHPGLPGGEAAQGLHASPGQGDLAWERLEPSPQDRDQTARLEGALFCEDAIGTRFRFPVGRKGRDVSRPDDQDRPAWATSRLVWTD